MVTAASLALLGFALVRVGMYAQRQKLRAESAERWVDEIVQILRNKESTDEQITEHVKTLDS